MSMLSEVRVLTVHHWTGRLFSFTTTRDPSFRFQSGQFTMIGLMVEGKPLLRAYSLASSSFAPELEFLSIKVPDGPLTSRLRLVQPGDTLLVGRKPSGTLLIDNVLPGRQLFLLATGTGIAPFMSLIRDPGTYERFERVVLVHGCRLVAELAYRDLIVRTLPRDELMGETIARQLRYLPVVTREAFAHRGRLPALLESEQLAREAGVAPVDPMLDRFMLCGSPAMLRDTQAVLRKWSVDEGNMSRPGRYVIERAFVDK
ncbi:MAG: ferredoxin--NADP reductase [Proteobacteria bacterium]|nr:ferredoxin--NADP reductase [Pseudomonadota bacterium]